MKNLTFEKALRRVEAEVLKIFTVETTGINKHLHSIVRKLFESNRTSSTDTSIPNLIASLRASVLDLAEQAFGHKPSWPVVRRQLLALFGHRGLEALIHNPEK